MLQEEGLTQAVRAVSETHPNPARTRKAVPWHTERVYGTTLPSTLVLACEQPPETGGRTFLLDGREAAKRILEQFPESEGLILGYSVRGQYGAWPLIGTHPVTGDRVLWYRQDVQGGASEQDRVLFPSGIPASRVREAVNPVLAGMEPRAVVWESRDVLIVDNYRMLHSRESYTGERRLKRVLLL